MKEKFEHIDELFREKMFNYSNPPPEMVWKRIENSIAENKKRSLIPFFLKLAAGIVFLAGLSALYIKINDKNNHNNPAPFVASKNKEVNSTIQQIQQTQKSKTFINKELYAGKLKKRSYSEILPDNSSKSLISFPTDTIQKNSVVLLSKTQSEDIIPQKLTANEDSNLVAFAKIDILNENLINPISKPKSENLDSLKIVPIPPNNLLDELLAENVPVKQKSLKWTIGGQAGPQYSYRKLTTNAQSNAANIDYDSYDAPLLAYAGGLQIQVEPSKRISIQSGLYYSKIGQSISSRNINYERNDLFVSINGSKNDQPVEIVNSIGTIVYPDEISSNNINIVNEKDGLASNAPTESNSTNGDLIGQQIFEYVEVPLMLRYKIIAQKVVVNLIGGFSTNILVNNSVKITDNSNITIETKTNDLKTFNYSGTVGFGFNYPVSKKILFNIEPFFKYYLSPINVSSQAEAQPYMIGIMTGLNYSF